MGYSILAIRITAAVTVGLTAFILYRSRLLLSPRKDLALFSGLVYVVVISSYRFGLAANTELFFNFFVVGGLYYLLQRQKHTWFIGGFLVGLGLIIKYFVLFDFVAFMVFFLLGFWQEKGTGSRLMKSLQLTMISGIGFLIPFLLANLYFYLIDHYDHFAFITFEVGRKYSTSFSWQQALDTFTGFHLRFLPLMLIFYYVLFKVIKTDKSSSIWQLSIIWFLLDWIMVLLPGKGFDHYYLQLLPSTCILVPELLKLNETRISRLIVTHGRKLGYGLVGILLSIALVNQSLLLSRPDYPDEVAKRLKARVQPHDLILTGRDLQITYYLLGLTPPYPLHPTLLQQHSRAMQIDPAQEYLKVMKKDPRFIVFRKHFPSQLVMKRLESDYSLIMEYPSGVKIFEIKQ